MEPHYVKVQLIDIQSDLESITYAIGQIADLIEEREVIRRIQQEIIRREDQIDLLNQARNAIESGISRIQEVIESL